MKWMLIIATMATFGLSAQEVVSNEEVAFTRCTRTEEGYNEEEESQEGMRRRRMHERRRDESCQSETPCPAEGKCMRKGAARKVVEGS